MERDPFLNSQEQQQQHYQQYPPQGQVYNVQHPHPHLMKEGSNNSSSGLADEQSFAMMHHPHQPYYPSSPPLGTHHHHLPNTLLPGVTGGESGGGVVLIAGGPNSLGARSESGGYRSPDIRASSSMSPPPRSSLALGYPSPVTGGGSRSGGSVVNYPLDVSSLEQHQQQQLHQGGYYVPYSPPQQSLSIQPSGYSPYLQSQLHPSPYDEVQPSPFGSRYSLVSGSGSSVAGGYPRHQQQQQYAMQPLKEKGNTGEKRHSGHGHYTQAPLVDLTGASTPILRTASLRMEKAAAAAGQDREGKEDDEISSTLPHRNSSDALPKGRGHHEIDQNSHDGDDDDEEEGQERGASRRRDGKCCWCCSRRQCVYMTFLMVILMAIALYFLIPRSPGFSFVSVSSMGDPVVSKNQFQEPFAIQIRVDNSENYLPLRLSSMDLNVWMKIDMTKVGNNDDLPSSFTFKAKQIQTISVPMVFDYTSLKIDTNSDGTFQQLLTACKPLAAGATPIGLNLVFGGKLNVWGLSWVWSPQFSFNVLNAPCPINAKDADSPSTPPTSPSLPPPLTASASGHAVSGSPTTAVATATGQLSQATASASPLPTQAAHP